MFEMLCSGSWNLSMHAYCPLPLPWNRGPFWKGKPRVDNDVFCPQDDRPVNKVSDCLSVLDSFRSFDSNSSPNKSFFSRIIHLFWLILEDVVYSHTSQGSIKTNGSLRMSFTLTLVSVNIESTFSLLWYEKYWRVVIRGESFVWTIGPYLKGFHHLVSVPFLHPPRPITCSMDQIYISTYLEMIVASCPASKLNVLSCSVEQL